MSDQPDARPPPCKRRLQLTLRDVGDPADRERRLRALLKIALRSLRFRCLKIEDLEDAK